MTDLQIITRVSPDQLENFAKAVAEATGQPFSLDQSMVGMTDHDENRATKVVFHAYEIPDIMRGINQALEAFQDLQRLPGLPGRAHIRAQATAPQLRQLTRLEPVLRGGRPELGLGT